MTVLIISKKHIQAETNGQIWTSKKEKDANSSEVYEKQGNVYCNLKNED